MTWSGLVLLLRARSPRPVLWAPSLRSFWSFAWALQALHAQRSSGNAKRQALHRAEIASIHVRAARPALLRGRRGSGAKRKGPRISRSWASLSGPPGLPHVRFSRVRSHHHAAAVAGLFKNQFSSPYFGGYFFLSASTMPRSLSARP